jgi:Cu-Zn family superoxide dismutase
MRSTWILALASVAFLAVPACSPPQSRQANQGEEARKAAPTGHREMSAKLRAQGTWGPPADLIAADGQKIGEVQTMKRPNGKWAVAVYSTLWDTPLPAGRHGVHIHAVGRCDGPDFATAGDHWNPTAKQHGHENPAGWHLGDLGNLEVIPPMDGYGKYFEIGTFPDKPTRLDSTDPGSDPVVRDADGASIVIHAQPDDEKTDPSGDSGDRIACGVIPAAE